MRVAAQPVTTWLRPRSPATGRVVYFASRNPHQARRRASTTRSIGTRDSGHTAAMPQPVSTTRHESLSRCLGAHRLFAVLTPAALSELAESAVERRYSKGHSLFYAGDPAAFVYMVKSGLVTLTELDERGNPHPILSFSAGEVFGIAATLLGIARSSTALALTDVEVVMVPKATFDRLYERHPEMARQVTREICWLLYRSEQTTFRFTRTPVASRLARFLIDRVGVRDSQPHGPVQFDVGLSHQDLALLLGTSRETIARVFARLSRNGILQVQGQRLAILDVDELRHIAEE